MIERRGTREVRIGDIAVGGDNPIPIQSMTTTDTADVEATVRQIKALEDEGCEIVRVAVSNMDQARAVKAIKEAINIPLVADIQFDADLAVASIENGVDKLRINPGNIGGRDRVEMVVRAAKEHGVPIRIGVNSGSIEEDLLEKYGGPTAEAMVESAARHIKILEDLDFRDIIVSLKASNAGEMVKACRLFSERFDYPQHLGVTEAGLPEAAAIKSAIGIGSLLLDGIGDTIRVSVTGEPVEEIGVAKEILKAAGANTTHASPEIISCPTCARTKIDLISIANEVERRLAPINKDLKVAVMGCVVNGPGEAREADIGVAGGDGRGVLFKHGQTLYSVKEDEIVDALMKEIESL